MPFPLTWSLCKILQSTEILYLKNEGFDVSFFLILFCTQQKVLAEEQTIEIDTDLKLNKDK